MIDCPKCGGDTEVIESKSIDGRATRRRRQCERADCSFRFTTYEAIPLAPLGSANVAFVPLNVLRAVEAIVEAMAIAQEKSQ